MNFLLVLPILLPLLTAATCLLVRRSRRAQRAVALVGSSGLLIVGIMLVSTVMRQDVIAVQISGWIAPFGITLIADRLSAAMIAITGVVALCTIVYSIGSIDRRREFFSFYPLVFTLLMGVCGSFLTGDIFDLYVWFEVMLMSSFVLLTLGGERGQLEGSIKYVTLNLLSSAIFLTALGLLYGLVGTLNMAHLALRIENVPPEQQGMISAVGMLLLVAFGIKAGIFPLFFWLPASYHTPPAAVSALFAALLTKVGVYSIFRIYTLIFVTDVMHTHVLLLWASGSTMLVGVLGALIQRELRRTLSFLIISHIGFMLIGVGLLSILGSTRWAELPSDSLRRGAVLLGLAGAIFYLFHHIVVKSALFFLAGVIERLEGTDRLGELGGFATRHGALAVLFFVPAFALAGIPPLSGFVAKYALVSASIRADQGVLAGVALVAGLLILLVMARVWVLIFWGEPKEQSDTARRRSDVVRLPLMIGPPIALAVISVAMGLFAGQVFRYAERAAEQLLDPSAYISAVFSGDTNVMHDELRGTDRGTP